MENLSDSQLRALVEEVSTRLHNVLLRYRRASTFDLMDMQHLRAQFQQARHALIARYPALEHVQYRVPSDPIEIILRRHVTNFVEDVDAFLRLWDRITGEPDIVPAPRAEVLAPLAAGARTGTANDVLTNLGALISSEGRDPRKVFIVHGRNTKARDAMRVLLLNLGLQPIHWSEAEKATGKPSPFTFDIVQKGFAMAQAVVVLLTPDEIATMKPALRSEPADHNQREQPRPNVLFEAGMAFMQPDRAVLVEFGPVLHASDLDGINTVRLTRPVSAQHRAQIRDRLIAAKCSVADTGHAWMDAGDFDAAFPAPPGAEGPSGVAESLKDAAKVR